MATCHNGGSNASLAGNRIGLNKGNMEPKIAKPPLGLLIMGNNIVNAIITGMTIGIISFGFLQGMFNIRYSVMALMIFFVIGLIILLTVPSKEDSAR